MIIDRTDLAGGEPQQITTEHAEARPNSSEAQVLPMTVVSEFRQMVQESGDLTNLLFDHFRSAHNFEVVDFIVETVENFSRELDAEDDEEECEHSASSSGYEREPLAMTKGMLLGWVMGLLWLEDEELEYLPEAREFVDEELYAIDREAGNGFEDQEAWKDIILIYGKESLDSFGAAGQCLAYYARQLGNSPDLWSISESGAGLMLKTLGMAKLLYQTAALDLEERTGPQG